MKNKHIRIIICNWLMMSASFYIGCSCGYKGNCFDVKINGVDVIPLSSQKLLAPYLRVSYDVRDAKWQVREPIDGRIDVQFGVNTTDGKEWIGDNPAMDIIIIPLENQVINTNYALSRTDNVRIEGQTVITASKAMKRNELPPGNYLFKVRLKGSNDWDRKKIFVMVK